MSLFYITSSLAAATCLPAGNIALAGHISCGRVMK